MLWVVVYFSSLILGPDFAIVRLWLSLFGEWFSLGRCIVDIAAEVISFF